MITTERIKKEFDDLANEIIKEAETFSFNLMDLPEIDYENTIRKHDNFVNTFDSLDKKQSNCIYWFETEDSDACKLLQKMLDDQRNNLYTNKRTVPVKNFNVNSKVLYVGIRQGGKTKKHNNMSHLSGRIRVHLGYYKVGSTQGLQLAHWARNIDCKINLKVVEFKELPNEYLNTIEKIVAFKLKPLCGKH